MVSATRWAPGCTAAASGFLPCELGLWAGEAATLAWKGCFTLQTLCSHLMILLHPDSHKSTRLRACAMPAG